ncbi:MAG: GtrA family protein [Clostridiaceae bacterium]
METEPQSGFLRWKAQNAGLWQFIMFIMMSGVTTLVDLGTFVLFNFWLLAPYREQAFFWGPFRYSVQSGGLTAFGAFAASFAVSQTFNFFLQRKTTFKANTNVALSAVMYAVMVIGVYALQLYLPVIMRAQIVVLLGTAMGDVAMKLINMTISMLIQFPMNKYVIMRRSKPLRG